MDLHRSGDLDKAEVLYRQYLNEHPAHADVNHLLGVVELQRGRLNESAVLIRQAVSLDPDHAFYRNSLGEAYRMQGDLGKAEQEYRSALKLLPDYPQALGNLGMILHAAGDFEEAVTLFKRGIDIEPENWDLHNNLGVAHQALGQLTQAIACFMRATKLQPQHAEALHNLSTAYKQSGQLQDAKATGEKCIRLAPNVPQAHWNLADINTELGLFAEAEPICRRAIEIDQKTALYHHTLARIVRGRGRLRDSIHHNQQALLLDPSLVQVHNDLGVSRLAMGDLDGARSSLTRCVELAPDFALAYENLAKCKRYSQDDRTFVSNIKTLAESLEGDSAAGLYFALGKIHDDMGEYDAAFDYYSSANRLKRATFQYDPDHQDAWTSVLLKTFDSQLLERLGAYGDSSDNPIFILGMPRSGTSLVEQILASHSQVFGAGELTHFYDFTQLMAQRLPDHGAYPSCAAALGEAEIRGMASEYLAKTRPLAPDVSHVTDKMPMNFLHLGLISAVFPKATIILCERDARDTCLSVYFQNFAARNFFAYDLYEIGRFHRQYTRSIGHWKELLGARLTRVRYEELTADPGQETLRLVEACGLPWEERCLEFYKTERAVQTASSWQVRQPMQTSSVERWRHYESHLNHLDAGLAGGRLLRQIGT